MAVRVALDYETIDELQSAGGYSGAFELSNSSALLALSLLSRVDTRYAWEYASDAEFDAIQNWVATAINELMTKIEVTNMITGTCIPSFRMDSLEVPAGFLLCDGTAYLKADYPELWDVLGVVFEVSATEFAVPDLRERNPLYVASDAIGDAGGNNEITLTGNQTPLVGHQHAMIPDGSPQYLNSGNPAPGDQTALLFNKTYTGSGTQWGANSGAGVNLFERLTTGGVFGATPGVDPVDITNAYLACRWIIKT